MMIISEVSPSERSENSASDLDAFAERNGFAIVWTAGMGKMGGMRGTAGSRGPGRCFD